jgi:hypothetical protein
MVQVPLPLTVAVQRLTKSFPVPETMLADASLVNAETVAVPADLVGVAISVVDVPLYATENTKMRLPDVTLDANEAVTAVLEVPVDDDLRDWTSDQAISPSLLG